MRTPITLDRYVVTFFLSLYLCACTHEDFVPDDTISRSHFESNTLLSSTKPTLNEFIKSVESEEEREFFNQNYIVDNTGIVDSILNKSYFFQERPVVKFTWHGKGGDGCKKPIGIGIIIPIGPSDRTNVDLVIEQGKYILLFEKGQEDNGLTSDGYLPIMKDVRVDDDVEISAGIYKANFSTEKEEYFAVGLDMK